MQYSRVHLPATGSSYGSNAGRCFRFITVSMLLMQIACSNPSGHKRPDADKQSITDSFSLSTFRLDKGEGYGYDILHNNQVIIHQEFIPALEGKQLFQSREDAVKIGNVVLKKIKNKKPPGITKEEVLQLLDYSKQ
jgi:hypothetical protein